MRTPDGEAALKAFVLTGFSGAQQRALQNVARNRDFAQRVLASFSAAYSPRVHEAADRALRGTDADREAFARTGFAEARTLDMRDREADEAHRQVIAQAERDFVVSLAQKDPGEQVRLAAQHALRQGSTDADIREFYATGWMAAAELDIEFFRQHSQEAGMRYLALIPGLIADAQEAEKEALAAGGAAAAQARAVAARAWTRAKDEADAARIAWETEQLRCVEQARYWQSVVDRYSGKTDPIWVSITGAADKNRTVWTGEDAFASGQSGHWAEVSSRAQAGVDRMSNPG
ncbi:short repeat uncharacterized protein predicted to be involved in signal transduction [Amycolatopsis sulphurea]|uniref:Short repeat uncharacterized protein predicted to be involved in signal transduction n=1 Tax=Amycolatopsis sulphurea TaxID=76022 RepID=A0A2A9FJN6_9PSEU|nr:hypothetical protein [Amycolatopsis sulphurea]PFG50720.1 short repeat uncharacterized protein predicted to be involved in signal transduction [Amycolatopsis sulphurea]